jgi:hypothetical protein
VQIPESDPGLEGNLPQSYGETEVVLLSIDPYLVHAYWEVAPDKMNEVKQRLGSDYSRTQPSLRFYEASRSLSAVRSPQSSFDVDIQLDARNWYVHLWSPDKTYHVDLGLRTEPGGFVPLATSNEVQTPPAWPAREVEEHYMRVEGEHPAIQIASEPAWVRPDKPFPVETEPVRSTTGAPRAEPPFQVKSQRATPAGPADSLRGFGLPEGEFAREFPNPVYWTPPTGTLASDLWKQPREAQLSFAGVPDSDVIEQNSVALTPEFPLPGYWLESKPVIGGIEEGAGEVEAAVVLGQQNLTRAGHGLPLPFPFDLCALSERALALGISSSFRTQVGVWDASSPIRGAESAAS